MGYNYGQKRGRMESLKNPGSGALYALGTTDINYEKFDEQTLYDPINRKLDAVDKRLQETK